MASSILPLELTGWQPGVATDVQRKAAQALEDGVVVVLPRVSFGMLESERRFLSPAWVDGSRKNISLERRATPGGAVKTLLRGARGTPAEREALAAMIGRFAAQSSTLVAALFPRYAPFVEQARTSFRPAPAVGRSVSWRKDDARLHVDAFPSRPTDGTRILRVFHNVNPSEDRVWRVGEPFEAMARTMLPRIRAQWPGEAAALAWLRVTKTRRSAYDHLMLGLHDRAKADLEYQRRCPQEIAHFAPGTTWICFSDQVMHAAVSGQYMLEQTIHLPIAALYAPERSPLAVLERLTGHPLVAAH